jgi:hypothetical protein
LEEFIQTFNTLSKVGNKTENEKLNSLVDRYFKKEWIQKFDQTSVYFTLLGLYSIYYKSKSDSNDILSNLSTQLSTVPISSTSQLLSSVSCLSRIGWNIDYLIQSHHKQIFARIMVDSESMFFENLWNLVQIRGLHWSHIPIEFQDKIVNKLPKFNDVGLDGAFQNLIGLGQLCFPITEQTPETVNKINELATEAIAEYCKKNDKLFKYTPTVILRQFAYMGCNKHTISPVVLKEFQTAYMERSDIVLRNIEDLLLTWSLLGFKWSDFSFKAKSRIIAEIESFATIKTTCQVVDVFHALVKVGGADKSVISTVALQAVSQNMTNATHGDKLLIKKS